MVVGRGILALALCLAATGPGCAYKPSFLGPGETGKPPRIRLSSYATPTVGTTYADPGNLGMHRYSSGKGEKNGIVYTCRGGHVDIAHLRKGADWTAFLAERTLEQLIRGRGEFSFKFYEPSKYFVEVTYPDNWEELPDAERQAIARDVAIRLGQYFAFVGCTWHEILTWFGYKSAPWYPEFPSAFSWEDSYSNLLGTHIAGQVLRTSGSSYDQAMTIALDRELKKLGICSKRTAIEAAKQVRGQWFSGDFLFLVDVKGRNLDIGLDDGFITPWLVPSVAECRGAKPLSYPVPDLHFLADYGFSVKLEIEPREFERGKLLKIVYPDASSRRKRIEPAVHFAPIMEYIERAARKKYGWRVSPEPAGSGSAASQEGTSGSARVK